MGTYPIRSVSGGVALAACAVLTMTTAAAATPIHDASSPHTIPPHARLYTPPPDKGAIKQITDLLKARDVRDARLIAEMISTPQAVWFTGGTPDQVRRDVHRVVTKAAAHHAIPVLVAYNIPFRDCSQYSAGGAVDTAAYEAWIDGFAAGIGDKRAIVLLEPDSLGIIPYNTDINGNAEWCKPDLSGTGLTPDEANQARYDQLNYAVDALEAHRNVSVYLDGTHSGWLGVGDIAQRLVRAGVQRAQGFFVNVSNYQTTERQIKYGTWISECIAFANDPEEGGWRLGHYSWCASQYYPANPNDFSTWVQTDQWYASNLGTAVPTTHFVIDTSRNGRGPNDMTAYAAAPYNQPASVISALQGGSWCNPPGRGLGLRPTVNTGVPLLDAYLWVKIPGESDGQCDAAGGARAWDYSAYTEPGWPTDPSQQALFDPLWGLYDPPAGQWFPQQALQLAQLAVPPLQPQWPVPPVHH
ncbi:Cellulase [Acidothermus cellulolyticus 11B]|uniref:Glucanase n=1 Tax=Acidothermus cellulolyticus (strain ATCC 43068 / DSM 8971 / 11B) TaxID=351607 RepID=A0LR50_ACIC1|nr:glycoside hydrolase family 6 protein [Acidothermus cellulolyticus]ABK51910.1 Cellulase [Acidothermus cellulolyticus 11B]